MTLPRGKIVSVIKLTNTKAIVGAVDEFGPKSNPKARVEVQFWEGDVNPKTLWFGNINQVGNALFRKPGESIKDFNLRANNSFKYWTVKKASEYKNPKGFRQIQLKHPLNFQIKPKRRRVRA